MRILKLVIFLLILLTAVFGWFFFRSDILNIYSDLKKDLQNFEKTELGNLIKEVKKEVLTPPPLNVGGKETQAVLTKAGVIAQTNIQRYNNGLLPPLIENAKLNTAALAKANDMFLHQYFDHISPSGVDPGTLVKSFGYEFIVTGENLILGNFEGEEEMVQLWMNSPGHRANILNDRFAEIGVAVVKGTYKGETVWIGVQEFGLPLSSCKEPSKSLKSQIDLNVSQLDQLILKIEAKKNEIESTNRRSPQYNNLVEEYNQLVKEYNSLNDQTKNIILQYNNQVNIFNQCVAGR